MKALLILGILIAGFSAHAENYIECVSKTDSTSLRIYEQGEDNFYGTLPLQNGEMFQAEFNNYTIYTGKHAHESDGDVYNTDHAEMNWPLGSYVLSIPEVPGVGTLTIKWENGTQSETGLDCVSN